MSYSINLNLISLNFTALAGFAQTIHDGYVTHAADFPAPNPLMPAFHDDIDAHNAAIARWGVKGNRGSHTDYLELLSTTRVIANDLRMLSLYAQNTKPGDVLSWTHLGFKTKRPKSKPQPIQIVQNLHHFIS